MVDQKAMIGNRALKDTHPSHSAKVGSRIVGALISGTSL
jgi:hypothetical protein